MTYINHYYSTASTTTASTTTSSLWTSNVTIYTSGGQRFEIPVTGIEFTTSTSTTTGTVNVSWGPEYEYATYSTYWQLPVGERRSPEREQETEYRRQIEERHAQRLKANEEAEALLWACLDNVQRGELAITDSFIVTASSGKRYRIRRGYAGNVEDVDGENIYSYCGHAYVDGMPDADQMLAQKFALETDEEGYRRIANASFLRPGTGRTEAQRPEAIERGRPEAEAQGRRIA